MKKMYKQPEVETTEVQAASMLLDASPAGLPVGEPVDNEGGD